MTLRTNRCTWHFCPHPGKSWIWWLIARLFGKQLLPPDETVWYQLGKDNFLTWTPDYEARQR